MFLKKLLTKHTLIFNSLRFLAHQDNINNSRVFMRKLCNKCPPTFVFYIIEIYFKLEICSEMKKVDI